MVAAACGFFYFLLQESFGKTTILTLDTKVNHCDTVVRSVCGTAHARAWA